MGEAKFMKVKMSPKDIAKHSALKLKQLVVAAEIVAKKKFELKRKFIEKEIEMINENLNSYPLQTPLLSRNIFVKIPEMFRVGNYISVTSDLSLCKYSHGGSGLITGIHGNGPKLIFMFDVKSLLRQ